MLFGKKTDEIDVSKGENENLSLEDMVEDMQKKLTELTANIPRIKQLEDELVYYKSMHNSRVIFYEKIIEKFLDKPVAPPPKSAVEAYLDSKKEKEAAASKNNSKSDNATAGPVGKLP